MSKNSNKKVFVVALLFLGFLGSFPVNASDTSPDWVHKKPSDAYVGTGTADTLDDAKAAALLDVARQISYEISLKIGSSGNMTRTEKDLHLTDEMTFSTPEISISGQQIKDWHVREGISKQYEVAVLVRYPRSAVEKAIRRHRAEQMERIARARAAIRRGKTAWKGGRVMEAIQTYAEAHRLSRETDRLTLAADIEGRIISMIRGLTLTLVSGDTQLMTSGRKIESPPVVRLTIRQAGGASLPAAGVPILFRWDNPDQTSVTVLTEANGEAVYNRSESLSVGVHRLTAELDKKRILSGLPLIDKGVLGRGMPPGVVFTLKVVPVSRPTRIIILVEETNMGDPSLESFVGQTLSEGFQQAGFRVVAAHEIGRNNLERLRVAINKERLWTLRPEIHREADLVVTGRAATRRGSENLGLVTSSHADLFIRVIDLKRDIVVAQKNVTSLAGFGDTPRLAGIRALTEAGQMVSESLVDQLSMWEEVQRDGED